MRRGTTRTRTNVVPTEDVGIVTAILLMSAKAFYLFIIGCAIAGVFRAYSNVSAIRQLAAKDMVLMQNVSDLDMRLMMAEIDINAINITLSDRIDMLDTKIDTEISLLNATLCAKIEAGDDNLQMQIDAFGMLPSEFATLQTKALGNMMNITLLQDKDMIIMNQITAIEAVGEMLSNTTMDLNVTVMQALIDAMALDGRVTMVENKSTQNMMDIMTLEGTVATSIQGDFGAPHTTMANQFMALGGTGIITTSSVGSLTITTEAVLTASADVGSAGAISNNLQFAGGSGVSTSASGNVVTINKNLLTATTDSGVAIETGGGALNVFGSGSVTTSGAGSTLTISTPPIPVVGNQAITTAHYCIFGLNRAFLAINVTMYVYTFGPNMQFVQVSRSGGSLTAMSPTLSPWTFMLLCGGPASAAGLTTCSAGGGPGEVCDPIGVITPPSSASREPVLPIGVATGDSSNVNQHYIAEFKFLTNSRGTVENNLGKAFPNGNLVEVMGFQFWITT